MISRIAIAATVMALFAAAIVAPLSAAQGMPHAVVGYVTDTAGDTVTGAAVTLHNERTDAEITTTTNSLGQYQADLSSLSGGYQVGDAISIKAVSDSMEGTSSVTVTANALDQCDIVLDTQVSEETPFPGFIQLACTAIILSALFGMAAHRKV